MNTSESKKGPAPSPEAAAPGTSPQEQEPDNCRCKEASNLTPAELVRLMLNDLAFWKKFRDR